MANAIPGSPTATGTLTDIDFDNPTNTFQAVSAGTASSGGYGTFAMTAGGTWTYTLDNSKPAVQALNAGQTLTDTFTVKTIDNTAQLVSVTINGSNDAAVISGTTSGSVVEAGGGSAGTPTATGTLTDADVDNVINTFKSVSSPTVSAGGYGTYTIDLSGHWNYTLNNANAAVQGLNAGFSLAD